jgi:hypothetical protein
MPDMSQTVIDDALVRILDDLDHTDPATAAKLRAQLARHEAEKAAARDRGDFEHYLDLLGSHERLAAFVEIRHRLEPTPRLYWRLLGEVWTQAEAHAHAAEWWVELLDADVPEQHHIMSTGERIRLAALPEIVTVYRGYSDMHSGGEGFSWTLDRPKAEWFAHRFASSERVPMVATGNVDHRLIVAYFAGRHEQEVVVPWPAAVEIVHTETVADARRAAA